MAAAVPGGAGRAATAIRSRRMVAALAFAKGGPASAPAAVQVGC